MNAILSIQVHNDQMVINNLASRPQFAVAYSALRLNGRHAASRGGRLLPALLLPLLFLNHSGGDGK